MDPENNSSNDLRTGLVTEAEQIEYLNQLIQEKEQLAQRGQYIEAESIKLRINELKENMNGQKKRDLDYQHMSEMQNLEDNFNKELMELNEVWEEKFNEFKERAQTYEDSLDQKHSRDMEDLLTHLDAKLSKQVKFSKEFLELKQSEMNLAKQERYIEAHYIKSKCDVLERNEKEKFSRERNEKIAHKSEQLEQKQFLEKSALKQKLDTEFEIMKKEKEDETAKIILKYKNKKLDLELQQKQEKNLSQNENLLKARTTSTQVKISNTKKKFHSHPNRFQFHSPELKMRQMSKTSKTHEDRNLNLNQHQNLKYNDESVDEQSNNMSRREMEEITEKPEDNMNNPEFGVDESIKHESRRQTPVGDFEANEENHITEEKPHSKANDLSNDQLDFSGDDQGNVYDQPDNNHINFNQENSENSENDNSGERNEMVAVNHGEEGVVDA